MEFCKNIQSSKCINFPKLARGMGLDYFADIEPMLSQDTDFAHALRSALKEIKFDLMDKVLEVAKDGKALNGPTPELSYVNAIIKHIDSDSIISEMKEEEKPQEAQGMTAEQMNEHLKRLGLNHDS